MTSKLIGKYEGAHRYAWMGNSPETTSMTVSNKTSNGNSHAGVIALTTK